MDFSSFYNFLVVLNIFFGEQNTQCDVSFGLDAGLAKFPIDGCMCETDDVREIVFLYNHFWMCEIVMVENQNTQNFEQCAKLSQVFPLAVHLNL